MVKVKPQIEMDENEVEGVIRAFIEGRQKLNWAIGKIKEKNLAKKRVKEIFDKFYSYSKTKIRFQELQNKLKELELL